MELHKNSSLRTSLRARPSLRNCKREQLEMKGFSEDKLLSSGTELEASHTAHSNSRPAKKSDRAPAPYMEVLPPRPTEVPLRMKDPLMKSQAGRKFFSLKRYRNSRSGSLKSKASARVKNRTLSFRSELANRIKRTTLGRFQATSMFDLRSDDDPREVELLYENLLGAGDDSEEDDNDSIAETETLDDLSVRSDSTVMFASEGLASGGSSLQRLKSKPVESLDLAGLSIDSARSPAPASNSSGSTTSEASAENVAKPKVAESAPQASGDRSDASTPPPSPRIASIRAHTMRKTSTSNAVMVLSGGDGYWDMHSGGNFSKNEDASLLFWIYKF